VTKDVNPMFWFEFKSRLLRAYAGFLAPGTLNTRWPLQIDTFFYDYLPRFETHKHCFLSSRGLTSLRISAFYDIELKLKKTSPNSLPPTINELLQYDKLKFKYCRTCGNFKHSDNDCTLRMPQVSNHLPPDENLSSINDFILKYYHDHRMTTEENKYYQEAINYLKAFLSESLKTLELKVYGSFSNALAAANSDLDISLNKSEKSICPQSVLYTVKETLKRSSRVTNLQPLLDAFCPVVKFKYLFGERNPIEVDITVDNELAVANSELIKQYCCLDDRVKPLIFFAKYFAKHVAICPRQIGGLSPFAIVLMVIYSLQCLPDPVLPSLQKLAENVKPRVIIDKNDCTYMPASEAAWKTTNKQSLAELFLHFLHFYAKQFDYEQNVISIRVGGVLPRSKKEWVHHSTIAIEDPFIMDLDLASKIYRSMHFEVRRQFVFAYNRCVKKSVFNQTPIDENNFIHPKSNWATKSNSATKYDSSPKTVPAFKTYSRNETPKKYENDFADSDSDAISEDCLEDYFGDLSL
jgi:DNA polymerase sigma